MMVYGTVPRPNTTPALQVTVFPTEIFGPKPDLVIALDITTATISRCCQAVIRLGILQQVTLMKMGNSDMQVLTVDIGPARLMAIRQSV